MTPEQQAELEALRAKVEALEAKVETLRRISWNLMRLALSANGPAAAIRDEDVSRVSDLVLTIGDQIVAIESKGSIGD